MPQLSSILASVQSLSKLSAAASERRAIIVCIFSFWSLSALRLSKSIHQCASLSSILASVQSLSKLSAVASERRAIIVCIFSFWSLSALRLSKSDYNPWVFIVVKCKIKNNRTSRLAEEQVINYMSFNPKST